MPKGGPPGVSGGVRWVQPPRVAQVMALILTDMTPVPRPPRRGTGGARWEGEQTRAMVEGVSDGVRWVQPPRMAQVMALILTDDAGAASTGHAGRVS